MAPPINTWQVTVTKPNDAVGDITAIHFDANGTVDATFTSRLKVGATADIDKFVILAKNVLQDATKLNADAASFASSIATQLNS